MQINDLDIQIIYTLINIEQEQPDKRVTVTEIIDAIGGDRDDKNLRMRIIRSLKKIINNQTSSIIKDRLSHYDVVSVLDGNNRSRGRSYGLIAKSSLDPEKEDLHRNIISRLGKEIIEKFLPSDTREHANQEEFQDHSYHLSDDQKLQSKRFLKSMGIVHRGLVLRPKEPPNADHLDIFYEAIKTKKQVAITLKSKQQPLNFLSILGLYYRDPKFYILVKNKDGEYKPYLSSLIKDVKLLTHKESSRPDDFDMKHHIKHHMMDKVHPEIRKQNDPKVGEGADVLLRLHPEDWKSKNPAIVVDIDNYRLHQKQVGPYKNEDYWEIKLPGQRISLQFIEYLAGRWETIEVLEPKFLRDFVKTKLQKTLDRYND